VINARDAMPDGGTVILRCAAVGDELAIEVIDQGVGMDDAIRSKIFDPFFTTKGEAGTGLGLAMVYGTITNGGGRIEVDSAPGAGSTFRLLFPRRPASVAAPAPAPASGSASAAPHAELALPAAPVVLAAGSGAALPIAPHPTLSLAAAPVGRRVLLLEDEPTLRHLMERMLARGGYVVSSHELATSARATVAADRFDLLVTDSLVPGGGVGPLIRAFRVANPGAPVVVCSGYITDQAVIEGIDRDEYSFLAKPFTPRVLLAALDRELARGQPS